MKTQQAQVIMLPTDKASNLYTHKNASSGKDSLMFAKDITWQHEGFAKSKEGIFYHLYFISDELIKEGNNIYNTVQKTIFIADEQFMKLIGNSLSTNKKIIATTNPDLWCKGLKKYGSSCTKNNNCTFPNCDISKIDTTFIEAYVKEQGKIDSVLLEYEPLYLSSGKEFGAKEFANKYQKLKLKSNGSVIIHKVKPEDSIQSILNYMAENRYNETNPVLYAYVASYIK